MAYFPGMLILFRKRLQPLILLLVLMTCNTSVWAAHIDLPESEQDQATVIHDHASGEDDHLSGSCDHCCHLSSHVLAITTESLITLQNPMQDSAVPPESGFLSFHGDPPFIPPIH